MQRNNLFKTFLIVFFLILALITLYPTFQVGPTQEKVDSLLEEISQLIDRPESKVDSVLCGDIQIGAKTQDDELSAEEQQERLV